MKKENNPGFFQANIAHEGTLAALRQKHNNSMASLGEQIDGINKNKAGAFSFFHASLSDTKLFADQPKDKLDNNPDCH